MNAAFALPGPRRPGRWVVTLADLALLLVGFFVMVHAAEKKGATRQMADAVRGALGVTVARAQPTGVALDADALTGFSAGDAALPKAIWPVAQWLKQAAADPRARVLVTGRSDDREADRSTSGLIIAASRADIVARALIRTGAIPASRVDLAASAGGAERRVDITISYGPHP